MSDETTTNLVLVTKFHEVPVEVRLNLPPLLLQHDELLVIEVGQLVMVPVRSRVQRGCGEGKRGMASVVPGAEANRSRFLLDGEKPSQRRKRFFSPHVCPPSPSNVKTLRSFRRRRGQHGERDCRSRWK